MPDKGERRSRLQEVAGQSTGTNVTQAWMKSYFCCLQATWPQPSPCTSPCLSLLTVQWGGRRLHWGKVAQPLALGGARPRELMLFVGTPALPARAAQLWSAGSLLGRLGKKRIAGCISHQTAFCSLSQDAPLMQPPREA